MSSQHQPSTYPSASMTELHNALRCVTRQTIFFFCGGNKKRILCKMNKFEVVKECFINFLVCCGGGTTFIKKGTRRFNNMNKKHSLQIIWITFSFFYSLSVPLLFAIIIVLRLVVIIIVRKGRGDKNGRRQQSDRIKRRLYFLNANQQTKF